MEKKTTPEEFWVLQFDLLILDNCITPTFFFKLSVFLFPKTGLIPHFQKWVILFIFPSEKESVNSTNKPSTGYPCAALPLPNAASVEPPRTQEKPFRSGPSPAGRGSAPRTVNTTSVVPSRAKQTSPRNLDRPRTTTATQLSPAPLACSVTAS